MGGLRSARRGVAKNAKALAVGNRVMHVLEQYYVIDNKRFEALGRTRLMALEVRRSHAAQFSVQTTERVYRPS